MTRYQLLHHGNVGTKVISTHGSLDLAKKAAMKYMPADFSDFKSEMRRLNFSIKPI